MSNKAVQQLKREARECELQVIERAEPGGLHIIVIGDQVVHWWPESRRQTSYVEGSACGQHHSTVRHVINLAQTPKKGGR